MKKWLKDQENRIELFSFLAVMIIACSPLFTKLCIDGHDLEYHLLRIESLKEGILAGHPFAKINLLFFGGAGYASSLFYPDFLLYIPAILRTLGVGINKSYHIFIAICVCLTYCSVHHCVKRMTQSSQAAIMAAILLIYSPYYMGDVLIRSAVGEYTAFIFLPFVVYGIYNTLYEKMDRPWLLGIGYGGVLLCHTTSFLFCVAFGVIAFLVKWKAFREWKMLLRLLLTTAVTALLTMFYWLPMLEMMLSTELKVSDAWITLEQTAMQFSCIFSTTFPALGFMLVILAFFRVLIKKNPQNRDVVGYADWLLFGGMFFAILTTDLIPWERLNAYLSFVQFPWRFFVLATVMLAIADSIIISSFIKSSLEPYMASSGRVLTILLLIVCSALALRFISNANITYYDYSDDYYSYKPYTANVIGGEWLPKTIEDQGEILKDSEHLYADNGEDLDFTRIGNRIEADIEKSYDHVDAPFIYYLGYQAWIKKDGQTLKLETGVGKNGLCRVYLKQQTGELLVKYAGTFLQHFSTVVSLVTAVLLIVFALYKKRKGSK